ncbi:MAG: LysR family transcriptional regulator [Burkholderiales bacterium]
MPSIRTLKTFLSVAQCGSFAAAGKQIGLTAAAVGLQIRALEDELRQPLFDRSARAVVFNTAGRELVAPVTDLVARYEALAARADGERLAGKLVMGALVSALMGAFADGLLMLMREHPLLEVKLFAGLSADFAQRVERGELDAAIVTQPPMPLVSHLTWTALYDEPMVLIVPRRPHFALPADPHQMLAECPFLRFDRQAWTGHLVAQALDQAGVTAREGMELNSVEAIIALVRQGFGVSIVPQLAHVQWARDKSLRLVPLPQVDVKRRVGILERRQHSRQALTDAIKACFPPAAGPHVHSKLKAGRTRPPR